MKRRAGPKSIIVQCTLACPLQCSHCATNSHPLRTERLALVDLTSIIDTAVQIGVSMIGFTGGDPFLLKQDLARCVKEAEGYGLQTMIMTSAFWATSEIAATKVLEPFRSLSVLGISADSYHNAFVPLERIRHAIKAARDLQIRHVELQVTGIDPSELESVRKALGEEGIDLAMRFQKLWPIGQARGCVEKGEGELDFQHLDLRCPMGAPFVMASKKVVGCCSSVTHLGDQNPVILGDWSNADLRDILLDADANRYYFFLKNFGLSPLLDLLSRSNMLPDHITSATDVCHLCYKLHSDPVISSFLKEKVSCR